MSIKATAWAWKQEGLEPMQRLVLLFLADCHNQKTNFCHPKIETIMARLCLSRDPVRRRLGQLRELGLVTWKTRRNGFTVIGNRYRFLGLDSAPPKVAEESHSKVAEEVPNRVAEESPSMVAVEVPSMVAEESPNRVAEEVPNNQEVQPGNTTMKGDSAPRTLFTEEIIEPPQKNEEQSEAIIAPTYAELVRKTIKAEWGDWVEALKFSGAKRIPTQQRLMAVINQTWPDLRELFTKTGDAARLDETVAIFMMLAGDFVEERKEFWDSTKRNAPTVQGHVLEQASCAEAVRHPVRKAEYIWAGAGGAR